MRKIFLMVILLCACSSKDKAEIQAESTDSPTQSDVTSQTDTVTTVSNSILADMPEASIDELVLPTLDLPGQLLIGVVRSLIHARFDGQQPTQLVERLVQASVEPSPSGRYFAYTGASETSRNSLVVVDSQTLEVLSETRLSNNTRIIGWSGDEQWLTFADLTGSNGTSIVRIDGSELHENISPVYATAWLDDNTIVYLDRDFQNDFILTELVHYDPVTRTSTGLPIEVDPNPLGQIFDYEDELYATGYRLAPGFTFFNTSTMASDGTRLTIRLPETQSATQICDTWTIQRTDAAAGTSEIAYTFEDTHSLTNITAMPDNSVLIVRWFREGCDFSQLLTGNLMRIYPDGQAEIIADNVMADDSQINLFGPNNNNDRHYAVSPDYQYVIWITKDLAPSATALMIADFETGTQARLSTFTSQSVRDIDIYQSIHWLP